MNLNIHIIFDELKEFSPQLITNRGTDLNLQQIQLPEISKGSLSQEYIYLLALAIEEHVDYCMM